MRKTKWRILAFLLVVSMITSGMAPAMNVQAAPIQQSVQTDGTSVDEETTVEESVTEETSVEAEMSTEEETPEGTPRFLKANTCTGWPPVAAGVTLE